MTSAPNPKMVRIGPVLRALREGARMTQRGLANAADVDHSNLSRVEKSERDISPELLTRVLGAIAEHLHQRGDAA